MAISIRDERGQAVVEYILTLIIGVAIILGTLYQFNTAFQSWAMNYFGDYLSCLLETGELPTIGGGGDGTVCNALFKPFNLADGRQMAATPTTANSKMEKPNFSTGSGYNEGASRGQRVGGGGSNGTPFTAGKDFGKNGGAKVASAPNKEAVNTGNTGISNYGVGYTGRSGGSKPEDRIKLDTRFRTEIEKPTRKESEIVRAPTDVSSASSPIKARIVGKRTMEAVDANTGLTIADFIRFLIIAAIIIALVLFLGGQLLQIGKSME